MIDDQDDPAVLVCVSGRELRNSLEASLASDGYAVRMVENEAEAVEVLKEHGHAALILEARRDAFARFLQLATRLRPRMPIQVIDGRSVFCLYPLARQPQKLIGSIQAAGVAISPYLLRFATPQASASGAAPFIV